jgi:hypothetical protein
MSRRARMSILARGRNLNPSLAPLRRGRSLLAMLIASLGVPLGAARVANAQESVSPPASVVAPAAAPAAADTSERDEPLARARLLASTADRLFLAGHYAAALTEYSSAYDILKGHPKQYWVLHNLAACNERLFRYDVAVQLYEEYLRRAPPTEADRAEVAAILRTLGSLLATLVIESSVPGEVWLDDRRLGAAPGSWSVPVGRHIVEVRSEGYESKRLDVQLEAGQRHVDHVRLQRLSLNTGARPGYFWTAVSLTGVATIIGASAGLMALSARERGRDRAQLYLDTQPDAERTRRWALAADASFGAAVLFGATATVLYFVTDWRNSEPPIRRERAANPRRSLTWGLSAQHGLGAIAVGQF